MVDIAVPRDDGLVLDEPGAESKSGCLAEELMLYGGDVERSNLNVVIESILT